MALSLSLALLSFFLAAARCDCSVPTNSDLKEGVDPVYDGSSLFQASTKVVDGGRASRGLTSPFEQLTDDFDTNLLSRKSGGTMDDYFKIVFADVVIGGISALVMLLLRQLWRARRALQRAATLQADDSLKIRKSTATALPEVAACQEKTRDAFGCTALHLAAAKGDNEEVKKLLEESGRGVDASDAWEDTPLHFAARAGHLEVCETLLAGGAAIDAKNLSEETPLLVAARSGHEALCEMLLEKNATVAGVADSKLPPLLVALLVQRMIKEPFGLRQRSAIAE